MAIFNTVPPLKAGAGIKFDGETISTGAAPRNLLDNSDFRNPVNQRGQTSYSLSAWGGYCIDRWAAYAGGGTVTIGSGGLTLSGNIFQTIASDAIARYNGKVLTLAAKISGTVYCCSGEVKQIGAWNASARFDTPYGFISFEIEDNNYMYVIIDNSTTPSVVEWAALYEGAYTAETLPEYHPKGYGAELAECQRYYIKFSDYGIIGVAHAYESNGAYSYVPISSKMRIIPSITYDEMGVGTSSYLDNFAKVTSCTNIHLNGIGVMFFATSSNLAAGETYALAAKNLEFSADL